MAEKLLVFIAGHEGYSPTPYWDYAQYTSGYGTRAKSPNERIDEAEARRRLSAEVAQARSIVERFAPEVDEGTKQALTSLTFNTGDKWTRSGLGQAIKSGDMDRARSLFLQYNKAGGKTLPGLVSRRQDEVALFGNPLSGAPQQATGGDFFASAPIGLTGNELPPLGAERPQMMALGGPNPEEPAQPQQLKPEPFNTRSYKVHPENSPKEVEWMNSPLGLVPKWSDGQSPLQTFKDGGRVKGLGDIAAPTEAQKEAGNYKKGHIRFQGLAITVENPKGSERSGVDKGGKRWAVKMPADYGYFKRTRGRDGDHVDCYIGPNSEAGKAYVVDQVSAEDGKFDEHKVMIGFPNKETAIETYKKAFNDGRGADRIGSVRALSIVGLKEWLASGDTAKPLGPQKLATGGVVGSGMGSIETVPFHAGALRSDVAGRADHLPLEVSEGSFVVPADVVSSLGQGNTEAGIKVLDEMFPKQLQTLRYAAGGRVPILAAGGEYVLSPEQVAVIGAGDLSAGHDALDAWVVRQRGNTIKTLQQLPGPAK